MSKIDQAGATLPEARTSPTSCGHVCKPDPIDIPLKKTKQLDETYMQEYKRAMMIYQQQFAFRPWAPFGLTTAAHHNHSHQLSSQHSVHHSQNVQNNQSHTHTPYSAMHSHPHSIHYLGKQSHGSAPFASQLLPINKTSSIITSVLQTSAPSSTMSHTPIKTGGVTLQTPSPSHNLPHAHHHAAAVSSLAAAAAANCITPYIHQDPPVLQHPERVVRDSECDHFERSFQPNVALAPRRSAAVTHVSPLAINSTLTSSSRPPLKADTTTPPLMKIKQERPTTPLEDDLETLQPENLIPRNDINNEQRQIQHHRHQQLHEVDDHIELNTSLDKPSSLVLVPQPKKTNGIHHRTTPPCSPNSRLQLPNKEARLTPSPLSLSVHPPKSNNSAVSPEGHSSSNEITSSTSPVPENVSVLPPTVTLKTTTKSCVALKMPLKPDMESMDDLHTRNHQHFNRDDHAHSNNTPRQLNHSPSVTPPPPMPDCDHDQLLHAAEHNENQKHKYKHHLSDVYAFASNQHILGRSSQTQKHQQPLTALCSLPCTHKNPQPAPHQRCGNSELELSTDTDDDSLVGEPDSSNNINSNSISPLLQWDNVVEALTDASDVIRTRVLNVVKQLFAQNSTLHRECNHLRQQLVQCQCNARHLVVRAAQTTTKTTAEHCDTHHFADDGCCTDEVVSQLHPVVSVIANTDQVASVHKEVVVEPVTDRMLTSGNVETIVLRKPPKKTLLTVYSLKESHNLISEASVREVDKDVAAASTCLPKAASVDLKCHSDTMLNSTFSNSNISGTEDSCSNSSSCTSVHDDTQTIKSNHNIPVGTNGNCRERKELEISLIKKCIQLTVEEQPQVVDISDNVL